jgi:uracil-DNA glycosylase family 4
VNEWNDILDAVGDYLAYRHECGDRSLSLPPESILPSPAQLAAEAAARTRPAAPAPEPLTLTASPAAPGEAADSPAARRAALERLESDLQSCSRCPLAATRTKVVPGQGNPERPDVLFIGEAPGHDEDQQGLAFVGAAGQLLTKMIAAMGYTRDEVFIANICKCRPPGNRDPKPEEAAACIGYLNGQIDLIRPKTIVTLGRIAAQILLSSSSGLSRMRGRWFAYRGIPVMPTFHPAYLLRYPVAKRDAWEDLKKVMARLGRAPAPPAAR